MTTQDHTSDNTLAKRKTSELFHLIEYQLRQLATLADTMPDDIQELGPDMVYLHVSDIEDRIRILRRIVQALYQRGVAS